MLDKETFSVGASVRVRARLRDNQLKPLLAVQVPISVASPSGKIQELMLEAEKDRPGWFLGEWRLRETGIHRMELWVPDTKEKIEKSVTAIAPNLEYEDPRRNDLLLDELTAKTGGKRFSLGQLAQLAEAIPDRSEQEIVSGVPITLWDRSWVMLVAVGLLTLEWIIRKLNNLA